MICDRLHTMTWTTLILLITLMGKSWCTSFKHFYTEILFFSDRIILLITIIYFFFRQLYLFRLYFFWLSCFSLCIGKSYGERLQLLHPPPPQKKTTLEYFTGFPFLQILCISLKFLKCYLIGVFCCSFGELFDYF